jgi:hypothetical protein
VSVPLAKPCETQCFMWDCCDIDALCIDALEICARYTTLCIDALLLPAELFLACVHIVVAGS